MAKNKKPAKEQTPEPKVDFISKLVVFASLAVVLVLLTAVIFPALYPVSDSKFSDQKWYTSAVSPWETGALAAPLIVVNAIIFGVGFLAYKNKSKSITSLTSKIQGFEVSKKVAVIAIVVLLGIYIASAAPELAREEQWDDYKNVKKQTEQWSADSLDRFDIHVNFFLLSSSVLIFDNIRVIPFLASIALLVLTFFVTQKVTDKRLPGIISMVVVLQSNIFLTYDTSATYTNFWIVLYLLSLYLVHRKWHASAISFLVSIPAKTLTFAFFPMSLFFVFRSNLSKDQKIYTLISYGVLIGMILVVVTALHVNLTFGQTGFMSKNFMPAFSSIASQLRLDGFATVFLLPVVVGLFLVSKKGLLTADSISVLISGSIIVMALLVTFTTQTNQPYRLIPLIVFFAIGVGVLFSKTRVSS